MASVHDVVARARQFVGYVEYGFWGGGDLEPYAPMWTANDWTEADVWANRIANCAGIINIARHLALSSDCFKSGTYGYGWWIDPWEYFDPNKAYPVGTILLEPYVAGVTEGHVAIVSTEDQYIIQSTSWYQGAYPGVTEDKTVLDQHYWTPWTWAGWMPDRLPEEIGGGTPVPIPVPPTPVTTPSDKTLIAAIDPWLNGYGAMILEKSYATGLPLADACGLVEKESNGQNIFGCDYQGPYCHDDVTYERVQYLRDGGNYSHGQQGVGLTQLTYYTLVEEAEALGGAHLVENQLQVGFSHLKSLLENCGSRLAGLGAYNAGHCEENAYAYDLYEKISAWETYLADPPAQPEIPDEPEEPEKEAELAWKKYTFAANDALSLDLANAAVLVLAALGVDAMVAPGNANTNLVGDTALAMDDVEVLNCVVVGKAAYDALSEEAKTAYGWKEGDPIWAIAGDTPAELLGKMEEWALRWIAEYGEIDINTDSLIEDFEGGLVGGIPDMAHLIKEYHDGQGVLPPPPPPAQGPKTLEERMEIVEGQVRELRDILRKANGEDK